MKNKLLITTLAFVGLVAGVAVAQQVQQLDKTGRGGRISQFLSGLLIGPDSVNPTNTRIDANRITRALGGSAVIDFAAGTIVCEDSAAITVVGARLGDPCFTSSAVTDVDAGKANSTFSCFVSATDAVKVRHCPAGTASNPASATYVVRVISAQ